VAVSECQVLGVILSGGQEGDAPAGEEMLSEVLARKDIKAIGADRAYDSDRIRAMIAAAGKQAVIPPRANRLNPAGYDKEKYKARNKVERLFGRLKGYRAVATRYDKLAAMFLGGTLAALLAVSLKCIVNAP
jgi:transposase